MKKIVTIVAGMLSLNMWAHLSTLSSLILLAIIIARGFGSGEEKLFEEIGAIRFYLMVVLVASAMIYVALYRWQRKHAEWLSAFLFRLAVLPIVAVGFSLAAFFFYPYSIGSKVYSILSVVLVVLLLFLFRYFGFRRLHKLIVSRSD